MQSEGMRQQKLPPARASLRSHAAAGVTSLTLRPLTTVLPSSKALSRVVPEAGVAIARAADFVVTELDAAERRGSFELLEGA